jgi:serine/threonine-protein kinase
MSRYEYIRVGMEAVARGLMDVETFAEAVIDAVRSTEESSEAVWLRPGRLTPRELNALRAAPEPSRRTLAYRAPETPAPASSVAAGGSRHGQVPVVSGAMQDRQAPNGGGLGRYTPLQAIADGGTGRILRCADDQLGRWLAIKTLKREHLQNADARAMLEREARVTSSLEHPNIIPVYDAGQSPDHGPYYAMRLVEQPSLERVLIDLSIGDERTTAIYGLMRLLRYFIQVCEAVDYAHDRGVIHCDLKPANILLGAFGEVLVVDWGLAFKQSEGMAYRGGTPGYMAPEQIAATTPPTPRTDVFALGAILYDILTLQPAFETTTIRPALARLARGESPLDRPIPPRERAPARAIPLVLEEICMKAMAFDPAERFEGARAMAWALEEFLAGTQERERRLKRAAELVCEGDALSDRYREVDEGRADRLAEISEARSAVAPWEPPERKRELWDAEDRAAVTEALGVRALQAAVAAYEQALDEVPEHPPARAGLARLYLAQEARARERHNELERLYFAEVARQYDDGQLASKDGTLIVCLQPPSATVEIAGYQTQGRTLVPRDGRQLTAAPGASVSLPPGSYSLTIRASGWREIGAPVVIHAGRASKLELDLPTLVPAASGEVLVPAGVALLSVEEGRESAPREVQVDSFFIAERPVRFEEYLAFLDDLERAGGTEVGPLIPANTDGTPYWLHTNGRWTPSVALLTWSDSPSWLLMLPVFGVAIRGAEAYATWQSRRSGLALRLPTESEWEKAARGVDGRLYPWGDSFDPSFCKMRQSRTGLPRPEPSGAFAVDRSPYGVLDMGGGVADWVTPGVPGARSPETAIARGGAWCDWPNDCEVSARRPYLVAERSPRVGFRLARSAGPPSGPSARDRV